MSARVAALAVILALTACNPTLYVESPAPPGRSARLDEVNGFWGVKWYRLELSTGVAIGLSCASGGQCEHMKLVSDNPAIAEVRRASLGVLKANGFSGAQQTASALVIVGKAPGKTTVHVTAAEGHREVEITVIAPPTVAQMSGDPTPSVAGAR